MTATVTIPSERIRELDAFLAETFDSVLRMEEHVVRNKLTEGLTIAEVHTIKAVGLRERNPMSVIAGRLNITLGTLTVAVNHLVKKGYVERSRCESDKRKVLVCLTKEGRKVSRAYDVFHKQMAREALSGLDDAEQKALITGLGKVRAFFDRQSDLALQVERSDT